MVCKRPFEFAAFEWLNGRLRQMQCGSFLGGCLAGALGAAIGCPFSLVKIRMQASTKEVHTNTLEAILTVWRSRGVHGFYQGLGASVAMQVPYATVYLGTYAELRELLPKQAWGIALAGASASLATCTLLQPLDTVRTLVQAGAPQEGSAPVAWFAQARQVLRQHGPLGLWAGWGPAAMRALPTSAISMLAYEHVRSLVLSKC